MNKEAVYRDYSTIPGRGTSTTWEQFLGATGKLTHGAVNGFTNAARFIFGETRADGEFKHVVMIEHGNKTVCVRTFRDNVEVTPGGVLIPG